jgi:bifunctional UDP-N-acetylglucosamine pyrophosphorylase/glucosamine-1-phosphate N-acetyltransferase
MSLNVVILAAGKGTRMRSSLPKVLHPVASKPMVSHVIETARQIGAEQLHLVYGHGAELLKERIQASDLELGAAGPATGDRPCRRPGHSVLA